MAPIRESIDILKAGSIDYEFRTTVVREFHSPEDMVEIGKWLKGAPRYFIQNFEDSGNLIETGFHGFTENEINIMADSVRPFFASVGVRGF